MRPFPDRPMRRHGRRAPRPVVLSGQHGAQSTSRRVTEGSGACRLLQRAAGNERKTRMTHDTYRDSANRSHTESPRQPPPAPEPAPKNCLNQRLEPARAHLPTVLLSRTAGGRLAGPRSPRPPSSSSLAVCAVRVRTGRAARSMSAGPRRCGTSDIGGPCEAGWTGRALRALDNGNRELFVGLPASMWSR